jgi:hypothetical protein
MAFFYCSKNNHGIVIICRNLRIKDNVGKYDNNMENVKRSD